jgi:DNA-binding Lrp family transcriptional regulator
MKKEILDLETRRRIYNYILTNPGVHFRDISKKLNIKVYNLKYHLHFLQKHSMICAKNENGYLRFYIAQKIGNDDKKILGFLRQKTTRDILLSLQWSLGLTLSELSQFLEKSPSTINFHLNKLIENDIITEAPIINGVIYRPNCKNTFDRKIIGREVIYSLKDPHTVYRIFTTYKKSLLDETTVKIFEEIYPSTSFIKRYRPINHSMDRFIDQFFEMFPHPYHV